jgi:cystathionine beta-lyase/cystathionine gamma-synthase
MSCQRSRRLRANAFVKDDTRIIPATERAKLGIMDDLIRLSVGVVEIERNTIKIYI